jgi:hypothetical protein
MTMAAEMAMTAMENMGVITQLQAKMTTNTLIRLQTSPKGIRISVNNITKIVVTLLHQIRQMRLK